VKPLLVVCLLVFFLSVAATQETQPIPKNRPPAEYKIPPEAARQTNPVKQSELMGSTAPCATGKMAMGKATLGRT